MKKPASLVTKLITSVPLSSLFLVLYSLLPAPVIAQSAPSVGVPQPPGFKIENVGTLISSAIGVALLIAGILVFVYLVWGGIQWITSGGDKAKTEEARSRITNALVGLAIVAAAWAVMKLIEFFFGITILSENVTIPRAY